MIIHKGFSQLFNFRCGVDVVEEERASLCNPSEVWILGPPWLTVGFYIVRRTRFTGIGPEPSDESDDNEGSEVEHAVLATEAASQHDRNQGHMDSDDESGSVTNEHDDNGDQQAILLQGVRPFATARVTSKKSANTDHWKSSKKANKASQRFAAQAAFKVAAAEARIQSFESSSSSEDNIPLSEYIGVGAKTKKPQKAPRKPQPLPDLPPSITDEEMQDTYASIQIDNLHITASSEFDS